MGKFVGVGRNKRIAKCTAAKRALRALKIIEDHHIKKAEEAIGNYQGDDEYNEAENMGFEYKEEKRQ